jgi:D-glycero-D-manno-heptose 1,7-bisphosphate phosphatase
MRASLVILDRDGVINAELGEHVTAIDRWRPLPGSLEAIARLSRAGVTVAVATNQSGIARGLLDEAALAAIHDHMRARLASMGASIGPVVHAPQAPDSPDPMRKPGPGMLLAIAERTGIGLAGVPYVGDSPRDIEAARAAGARPVLVRTGNGAATLAAGYGQGDDLAVYDDLAAFAADWLAWEAHDGG